MSGFWIVALLCLWAFAVVLGLLVLGLLRRIAPILERAEAMASSTAASPGLPPGSALPPFEVVSGDGRKLKSSDLVGSPFVLLFVSSGCAPCKRLGEEMRRANEGSLVVDVVVVADQSDAGIDFPEWEYATLAYQSEGQVSRALGSSATPHAFAIGSSGVVVAAGFPNTLNQLKALANQAREGGDVPTTHVKEVVSA